MKVIEFMERAGMVETGRAIAYIKDALEELCLKKPTHIRTEKQDIKKDQRYYSLPSDSIKIIDIKCKNHNNSEGDYYSIPRSIYEPGKGDSDGI